MTSHSCSFSGSFLANSLPIPRAGSYPARGAGSGMTAFTESVVEQAALAWLESVGWIIRNGAEIAPGESALIPGIMEAIP